VLVNLPKVILFSEFHPDRCLVKSQGTNKALLQGVVGVDGLYSFNNLQFHPQLQSSQLSSSSKCFTHKSSLNNLCTVNNSIHMLHNRLDHPNSHIMQIVLKHCKISLSNKVDSYFCSSYCVGKSNKLSSHASKSVYSPLKLVFTNL